MILQTSNGTNLLYYSKQLPNIKRLHTMERKSHVSENLVKTTKLMQKKNFLQAQV